jgi:hypothetical protein
MRPLLLDALNHSSVTTPKWQQRVREATPPHEGNSNIKAESLLEEYRFHVGLRCKVIRN